MLYSFVTTKAILPKNTESHVHNSEKKSKVTWQVSLMEQELLTFLEHPSCQFTPCFFVGLVFLNL